MEMEFTRIITEFGAFGVLVWLVIYDHRVLIPKIVKEFREEIKLEREEYRKLREEDRELFMSMINANEEEQ